MNLPLIPGTLPAGWCPTSLQELYNKMFALGVAQLDLGVGYSIKVSDAQPTAEEQGATIWYKTIGGVPDRMYIYYGGYWVAPHAVPASSDFRMIVAAGSEADVWSLDGGDGTDPAVSVSDYTGAMWQVDHDFDFRTLLGVGTNTVTTNSVAIGGTGGVEEVTLTTATGGADPNHFHTIGRQRSSSGGGGDDVALLTGTSTATGAGFVVHGDSSSEALNIEDAAGAYAVTSGSNNGGTVDDIEPHTNMPPYRGVWIVRRSSRKYYTA